MKVRAWTAAIACLMLVAVACSSTEDANEDAGADTTTTVVAPTTTAAPTTTTTSATTTDEDRATVGFEVLRDEQIVYFTDDEGDWTMDVFHPSEPGPWPLVVIYHGMTTNPSASEARTIAGTGAVVVAPRWIKRTPPTMTREEYIDGHEFDRAACATAAAQELATSYGADPAKTTVAGFSAGMHPAAWVGLGVVREDLCDVSMSHLPTGLVLGDSQFLFYEEGWDDSFADTESPAPDTTDRFVNPERWNLDGDVAVYLWTSDAVHGRSVASPPPSDSWITARDTTGDLVEDLEALDAFDDEFIDWRDNAKLLEMRLAESGYSVIREDVGGGHSYGASVFEMIDTLIHRDPLGPVNASTGWVWPSTGTLVGLSDAFCNGFPALGAVLHDEVSLAVVGDAGWADGVDEATIGRQAVLDELDAMAGEFVSCGGELVVQADWVATPFAMVDPDSTGSEGVFVLKSSNEGLVTWITWYRTETDQAVAEAAQANPDHVAAAMATCEAIEGYHIVRDADEYLALMADDPEIHSIPNGYHTVGEEGVRRTVELYPYSDDIGCVDRITATATWSVVGMTLDNYGYGIALEGPAVHRHAADGIVAIYHHWTNAAMSPSLRPGIWGTAPAP